MEKVKVYEAKSFFLCADLVAMALCWDCKGFHFNFKMIPCLEVNEGKRFSVRNKGSLPSPTSALPVSRLALWRRWKRWPALCRLKK